MTTYRFDIGVSITVRTDSADPADLVEPFKAWLTDQLPDFPGEVGEVVGAWREGITEVFKGDDTEQVLVSF